MKEVISIRWWFRGVKLLSVLGDRCPVGWVVSSRGPELKEMGNKNTENILLLQTSFRLIHYHLPSNINKLMLFYIVYTTCVKNKMSNLDTNITHGNSADVKCPHQTLLTLFILYVCCKVQQLSCKIDIKQENNYSMSIIEVVNTRCSRAPKTWTVRSLR